MKFTLRCFFLIIGILLSCSGAYATSGSTDYGYGVISKSLGGTGVANPQSALAAATNPAGIVFVKRQAELGVAFFSPQRKYQANAVASNGVAPGTHDSNEKFFILPNFGYVTPFSHGKGAWSISLYGNGGVNTNYGEAFGGSSIGHGGGVYGGGDTLVDLKQLFTNFAVAWKINHHLAIGASVIFALQTFKANGFSPFARVSSNPSHLTDKGTDYSVGLGARVGLLAHINRYIALGLSYQPEIPTTKFTDYSGLLPNGGSFDVPPRGTIGLSIKPTKKIALNFDVQHIWYSAVPAYSNLFACTTTNPCLGNKGGSGFGWRNTTVYKIGLQWLVNTLWTVRMGFAHSTNPVRSSQVLFNVVAPAVVQNHVTVGFSRKFGHKMALNVSALYVFNNTVTGKNPLNPKQTISLSMHQYELGFSWTWFLPA